MKMLFRQICLRGHKFIESFFHAFMVETFHFAAGHCDFKKGFDKWARDFIHAECNRRWLPHSQASALSLRAAAPASQLCEMLVLSSRLGLPQGVKEALCKWAPCFARLSVISKRVATFFMFEIRDIILDLEQEVGKFPASSGVSVLWAGCKLVYIQHLHIFPIPCWCCAQQQLCAPPGVVNGGGNMSRYLPDPPSSPCRRHRFPPAYSVSKGGRSLWWCWDGSAHAGFRAVKPPLHNTFFFLHEFAGVAISLSRR